MTIDVTAEAGLSEFAPPFKRHILAVNSWVYTLKGSAG